MAPNTPPIETMEMACEPCRSKKRKCDRATPVCGRCKRVPSRCVYNSYRESPPRYQPGYRPSEVNPRPADALARLPAPAASHANFVWVTRPLNPRDPYPIEFRSYMPDLIKEYCEGMGSSRAAANPKSTTYKLQSTWIQNALSDPCLFHATLFAGSSHFDVIRGGKPSAVTLFHQNEVIRLINERLSDPTWALDDRTIAAITPLSFFASLTGNRAESEIHGAGLQRMIKMRGGFDQLGLDGIVATVTHLNDLIRTIAFDLDSDYVPQGYHVAPPLGLECRILTYPQPVYRPIQGNDPVLSLFGDVYDFKLKMCRVGLENAYPSPREPLEPSPPISLNATDPILHSCCLAVSIFWLLTHDSAVPETDAVELASLISRLKSSLEATEEEAWLVSYPIAHTWVCMTGAAAAADKGSRIWFYVRQANTTMAMNTVQDFSFLDDVWVHFYWLRSRRFRLVGREEALE